MSALMLVVAPVLGLIAGWIAGALILRDGMKRTTPAAWGVAGALASAAVFSGLSGDVTSATGLADPTLLTAMVAGALLVSFVTAVVIDSGEDRRRRHRLAQSSALASEDGKILRRALIHALLADATSQDAGHVEALGKDATLVLAQLSVTRGPVPEPIHTALSFWSGWIAARENGWAGSGIERAEWPPLARGIAMDLAQIREIHDRAVLAHFAGRRARPFVRRA